MIAARSSNRCFQDALSCPSRNETFLQSAPLDASQCRPFGQAMCFSVQRQVAIRRMVMGLFKWRGPSTIVRRIASIVVDAFQCQSRRAWPHICQKVFERRPPIADTNSARAVSSKARTLLFSAAVDHVLPACKCPRFFATARLSMERDRVDVKTSTTSRVTAIQRRRLYAEFGATVASTAPSDVSVFCPLWHRFDCHQSAESIASVYSAVSHAVSLHVGDGAVRGQRALDTFAGLAFNYPIFTEVFG